MKSVLVIGSAGFVGPYLVDNLRRHNYKVIPTKLSNQKVNDKTFINLNILDKQEIDNVLKKYKPNYIVNLAAQASVGYSWKNPILTFNINVMGVLNLLESIRLLNLKTRVLLIGTADEYGEQSKMPIKESFKCNPSNFYALSKITQEDIGKIYVKCFNLNIVFTRSFNHIGIGQNIGFVVPDFCSQVVDIERGIKKAELHVGNLKSERDFSDVIDIANAYRLLLEKGKTGETYNVGTGKTISIENILNIVLSNSTKKIKIISKTDILRKNDTKIIKANIDKLKKDTGFKPKNTDIKSLIADILTYLRSQK